MKNTFCKAIRELKTPRPRRPHNLEEVHIGRKLKGGCVDVLHRP